MKAIVVFCDPDDARWQWLLKPGFRHVFCVIAQGDYWISIDSRVAQPVIEVVAGTDFDLAGHYRREMRGWTVLEIDAPRSPWRAPYCTANCVGLVKAILGIRAPLAQSPHQLFKHLKRIAT